MPAIYGCGHQSAPCTWYAQLAQHFTVLAVASVFSADGALSIPIAAHLAHHDQAPDKPLACDRAQDAESFCKMCNSTQWLA